MRASPILFVTTALILSSGHLAHAGQIKTFKKPVYVEKDEKAEDFGRSYRILAKSSESIVCMFLTNGKSGYQVGDLSIREMEVDEEETKYVALVFMNDFSPNVQFDKREITDKTVKVYDEISCELPDPEKP